MEMTKSSNDLLRVPNPFQKEDEFPDCVWHYSVTHLTCKY